MYIFIIPVGFVLWYLAYEAKPIIDENLKYRSELENIRKRGKLLNIINGSFQTSL